jgi:hypothetical protein
MAARMLRHEHVAIKIHGSRHQQMRRTRYNGSFHAAYA